MLHECEEHDVHVLGGAAQALGLCVGDIEGEKRVDRGLGGKIPGPVVMGNMQQGIQVSECAGPEQNLQVSTMFHTPNTHSKLQPSPSTLQPTPHTNQLTWSVVTSSSASGRVPLRYSSETEASSWVSCSGANGGPYLRRGWRAEGPEVTISYNPSGYTVCTPSDREWRHSRNAGEVLYFPLQSSFTS